MCVVAFAWRHDPRWPLVLVGNRDELHDRPAAPLARWDDPPGIVAGRDLRSGGTWLGVTAQRIAVVTNLRWGDPDPAAPSRGALVLDALADALPGDRAIEAFNPFNLLVIGSRDAMLVTNRPTGRRVVAPPGPHGMANGALDEPCARVTAANERVAAWLGARDQAHAPLLEAFGPGDGEGGAAPLFLRNSRYGTRCTTVVTVDAAGALRITERRYGPDGTAIGESGMTIDWEATPTA